MLDEIMACGGVLYGLAQTGDDKMPYTVDPVHVTGEVRGHLVVVRDGVETRIPKSKVWLSGNTPDEDPHDYYYSSPTRLENLVSAYLRGQAKTYRVWAVMLENDVAHVSKAVHNLQTVDT